MCEIAANESSLFQTLSLFKAFHEANSLIPGIYSLDLQNTKTVEIGEREIQNWRDALSFDGDASFAEI
jgi:hypothetical protein